MIILVKFYGKNPKKHFRAYGPEGVVYPSISEIKNSSVEEHDLISLNNEEIITSYEYCRTVWDWKGNYITGMLYNSDWKISPKYLFLLKKIKEANDSFAKIS